MIEPQILETVPDGLFTLLQYHLPESLTLLRRLQSIKLTVKARIHARLIFASQYGKLGSDTEQPDIPSFSVTYVDVAGGPDTQMWLYSTLQDDPTAKLGIEDSREQLKSISDTIIKLCREYGKDTFYPHSLILGSLESNVQAILAESGRIQSRGDYDKWIFDFPDIPEPASVLQDGMIYGTASMDDCRVVASRTHIPRPVELLFQLPNVMIKLSDGTPIAWAFLGYEGTLTSVHCEEAYRGRGFAKAVSAKLFREKLSLFGPGALGAADVAADNSASRAMCKSLGGHTTSVVSWVLYDISDQVTPHNTTG